jgi:hypothetical protein
MTSPSLPVAVPEPFAPTSPAAVHAAAAAASDACANCGTPRAGPFCHGCGQEFLGERLTLRLLVRQFGERVRLERGILRTMWDMTLDPGRAIRSYVTGTRRRYVNPFTYLFFGAAASLVVFPLYRRQLVAWIEEISAAGDGMPFFSDAQTAAYNHLLLELVQRTALTGMAMCILFALLIRLFFRRQMNLPEASVFSLYTFGQVFVLHTVLVVPWFLWLGDFSTHTWGTFVPYVVVILYAGIRYFGRPVVTSLKLLLALAVSYGLFSLAVGIGLVAYVLLAVE